MDIRQIGFLVIVFAVVVGVALVALLSFSSVPIRERLGDFIDKSESSAPLEGGWIEKVAQAAQPFSRLSLPEEGWERSPLRTRFMNAGWRSASAPPLYFAAKTILALA